MLTNDERRGRNPAREEERLTLEPIVAPNPATVNSALEALLAVAAEAGARRVLAEVKASPLSRWVPLRESPLGYRPTLELVRRGELTVHGLGHHKYLDREQVDAWLLAHPLNTSSDSEQSDEIAGLIAASDNRRAKRKGAK